MMVRGVQSPPERIGSLNDTNSQLRRVLDPYKVGLGSSYQWTYTLPETNIAPENGWLED